MKPPKIIIPIDIVDTLGCVYKLHYAGKYVVVMGKSTYRTVWSMNDDLERYFNGINEKYNQNNLYQNFYRHVLANPKDKFTFEMVISTDNAYQLLKHCQIELDKGSLDPNCYNTFFTPYVNKDIQKPAAKQKSKWWVSRGAYLNYLKWRKRHFVAYIEGTKHYDDAR